MNNKTMVKLDREFQRKLFEEVVKKYGGSIKAGKILGVCASSIRGYKNHYFKSVPMKLINKLIKLKIITKEGLNKNILSIFENNLEIKKNLNIGRIKRKKNIEQIKNSIPSLDCIIEKNSLDVHKWFLKYKGLLEAGFRKVKVNEKEKYLILKYNNFTKKGFKNFEVKLPKKIRLNKEFNYFLGLWCGDRAGGKRFGVTNKNKGLIKFTENFLKKYFQKIERALYIKTNLPIPNIKYDKKYLLDNSHNGWVLSVHSNNGVLSSFFHYLQSNLEDFLEKTGHIDSFFAGLFDAEGNVSLYNKSFRWACQNKKLIPIYSHFLKKRNLYFKYDGACLITYDKERFYRIILPYLKHHEKIKKTKFLCKGCVIPHKRFTNILNFLSKNPQKTSKEISKALKKSNSYFELKLLSDFNFVTYKGYPYKFEITKKGLNSLGGKNYNTN